SPEVRNVAKGTRAVTRGRPQGSDGAAQDVVVFVGREGAVGVVIGRAVVRFRRHHEEGSEEIVVALGLVERLGELLVVILLVGQGFTFAIECDRGQLAGVLLFALLLLFRALDVRGGRSALGLGL